MPKGSRVSLQEGPTEGEVGRYLAPLAFLKQLKKTHVGVAGGYTGRVC